MTPDDTPDVADHDAAHVGASLRGMRLSELLTEVQERLSAVARAQSRVDGLLDAFLTVSSGLDLDNTLRRIVEAGVDLVDARYGAMGVLDPRGGLAAFVHVGIDPERAARMGHLPEGKGVLGRLISDPQPLRIVDLGADPSSVGFPPHHPPMRSFLGVPVLVRNEVYGNLYITEKRNGAFTAEDQVVLTALAGAAGIAIDNARLYEEGQMRRRWLTVLGDVRSALLGDTSPSDVLTMIVDSVASLTEADAAVLMFGPAPDDGTYEVGAHSGAALTDVSGERLAIELEPVLQAVAAAPSTVVLDTTAMPSIPLTDQLSWGPAIAVPLRSREGAQAVIVATRLANRAPFDLSLVPLITSFAEQTAIALDMAERQRDARRLDLYEDRDRIARDLHDQVIQRIFAAGLSLQSVVPRITNPQAQRRVQTVVGQLDDTVRDIRMTIFNLQTTGQPDEEPGLRRRVLDVVLQTAGTDVHPTVRMSGPVDTLITGQLAADVEAVVREGVSNAVRHGDAKNVTITVDISEDVVIEIADDGIGFDHHAPRSGLHNLEERARRHGGDFAVTNPASGGTRLRWRAPLPRSPEADQL